MKCSPDHQKADSYLWSYSACVGIQKQARKGALGSRAEASVSVPDESCTKDMDSMSRPRANYMSMAKQQTLPQDPIGSQDSPTFGDLHI